MKTPKKKKKVHYRLSQTIHLAQVVRGFVLNGKEHFPGEIVSELTFAERFLSVLFRKGCLKKLDLKGKDGENLENGEPVFRRVFVATLDNGIEDPGSDLVSVFSSKPQNGPASELTWNDQLDLWTPKEEADLQDWSCASDLSEFLNRETVDSAEYHGNEFFRLLQTEKEHVRGEKMWGEDLDDDLTAIKTDGRCWKVTESIQFSGFDVGLCLDVSGSTFTLVKNFEGKKVFERLTIFTRIIQLGYWFYLLSRKAQSFKIPFNLNVVLFASGAMKMDPKDFWMLKSGLEPISSLGFSEKLVNPLYQTYLFHLGNSTSLISSVKLGLENFVPAPGRHGLFVVVTDISFHGYIPKCLDSLEIPERVSPVYFQILDSRSQNKDVEISMSDTQKWLVGQTSENELSSGNKMIEWVVDFLSEKVTSIVKIGRAHV